MKTNKKKAAKKAAKPAAKKQEKPAPGTGKGEVPFGPDDKPAAKADVKLVHATTGVVVSGKTEKKAEKQPAGTLVLSRAEFEKDLAVALDFAEKKSTLPVLTHVLIGSNGDGHVRIAAANLEQFWSKLVAGKGPKLSRCIPAALLQKEVRALPPDIKDVELHFKEDGTVSVNGRCTIYTMPAAEFPETPAPKDMREFHVDGLISGLNRVAHAMGENDSRYVLNGAYLDMDKKLVVATDGHRLAYEGIHVRGKEKLASIILPRRAVLLIAKYPAPPTPRLVRDGKITLAADNPDKKHAFDLDVFGHKVKVAYEPNMQKNSLFLANIEWRGPVNEGRYLNDVVPGEKVRAGIKREGTLRGWLQIEAERQYMELHNTVAIMVNSAAPRCLTYPVGGGVMLTKTVDGSFPNYQSIIPKETPIRLKFGTQAFLQNIEGALPLTPSETKSVLLRVNGKMEIQTSEPDKGEFKWHIHCEATGKKGELVLRYNIRYLVEAIKSYMGQDVVFELKEQLGPCRINSKEIVMPMRP